jgi:DNA-binding PadR family transcriptional regulator
MEEYRFTLSNFDNLPPHGTRTVSDKELYSGLIRLHILYHAGREEIFGLGIIEELARHGYKLSPGTLYPILHGLERKGYLQSSEHRDGKRIRRVYRSTAAGKKALVTAKVKVNELVGEIFEKDNRTSRGKKRRSKKR